MTRILRCNDVVPSCPAEVRAETEEEVLRQAAAHAREAHGLSQIDAETAKRIQAAIRTDAPD